MIHPVRYATSSLIAHTTPLTSATVNAGSGWHDTPAPAGFTTGLDSNDKHANDSFGDENDEGVMLNGGQSGGLTGECYNCGEVG